MTGTVVNWDETNVSGSPVSGGSNEVDDFVELVDALQGLASLYEQGGLATLTDGVLDPTQVPNSVQLLVQPSVVLPQWIGADPGGIVVTATRNLNEVITTGTVVWPDGATGVFTTDTINATFNTIDAYHVTYVAASGTLFSTNHTVTQAAMTRDASGGVTARPNLAVS